MKASIPEALLQEVWRDWKNFLVPNPRLSDGAELQILNAGEFNSHRGGPDFLNAAIGIEGVAIKGDVELHISPELWGDHGHDEDKRYASVILHVVLEFPLNFQSFKQIGEQMRLRFSFSRSG